MLWCCGSATAAASRLSPRPNTASQHHQHHWKPPVADPCNTTHRESWMHLKTTPFTLLHHHFQKLTPLIHQSINQPTATSTVSTSTPRSQSPHHNHNHNATPRPLNLMLPPPQPLPLPHRTRPSRTSHQLRQRVRFRRAAGGSSACSF